MTELDEQRDRPARPGYVIAALLLLWAVGMLQVAEGWNAIHIVRDPAGAASAMGSSSGVGGSEVVGAIGRHAAVTLPIGIAELMLGGMLLVLTVRGLIGRHVSAGFLLQVIFADAALLMSGYVLEAPVREVLLDVLVAASHEAAGTIPPELAAASRATFMWMFRGMVALELGALALGALTFTRRRAREALAQPEPEPEE